MILRRIRRNSANFRDFFRNRTKSSCNWPEISRYCGCCKLSTGIYIKTLITLSYTFMLLYFSKAILMSINVLEQEFNNIDRELIDNYLESIGSNQLRNVDEVSLFIRAVRAYFIFWAAVKIMYIFLSLLLVYSVYKGNAFLMKIAFFVITPTSVFDLFMSIIGTALLRIYIQSMVIFIFFMEVYNVVAVSSEYKRLAGKSRIVKNDLDLNVEQINPNVLLRRVSSPPEYRSIYGQSNQGCNHLDNVSINTDIPFPHSEQLSPLSSPRQSEMESKPLNFKDENIIFDQDQFVEGHQLVASNSDACNSSNLKQSVLIMENYSLVSNTAEKHSKIDVIDIPIIYDESQLNVGESPVYEKTVSLNI